MRICVLFPLRLPVSILFLKTLYVVMEFLVLTMMFLVFVVPRDAMGNAEEPIVSCMGLKMDSTIRAVVLVTLLHPVSCVQFRE